MPERWRKHLRQYGKFNTSPYAERGAYPRFQPFLSRRDSFPPNGGAPGSDVAFIREQLLDQYNIAYGVLEPLLGGNTSRNLDEAAVLCSAMNDWQAYEFTDPEPRLRASILVPQDDPDAAVKEIEKRAGDWRFAQIQLGSKTSEPIGRRRYWPIFAAAQAHGLSIGLHVGGTFASAPSAGGWPQFYIEEHHSLVHTMQNQVASLILEGVFEAFPKLKVVMIEGGFAWVPHAGLAAGCALGEDARRGAAGEAASRPNTCGPTSGTRPSRWRSRNIPTICARCSNGSAGTAWCIPATIRTGTSTIRTWRSASR